MRGYRKQSAESKKVFCWHLILRMIILKHENRAVHWKSDIEAKDKEMYDLKHELISVQIKLEGMRIKHWTS